MNIQAAANENSVFVTNEEAVLRKQAAKAENGQKGKRSSIYSGNLNLAVDRLAQRKKLAQKQAMKVVKDVFDSDQKFDQSMDNLHSYIDQLREENQEYLRKIREIPDRQEGLRQSYGVAADSEEQKELELLRKGRAASRSWNQDITLSAEEKEQIAKIQERGMTDYQKDSLALDSEKELYSTYIERNRLLIEAASGALGDMQIEQLKEHPMVDAMGKMEEVMQAVNKNMAFELLGEGVDHIQEEQEEKEKEAEKQAEKKEEQEERIEEQQEKKAEKEEAIEEIRENARENEEIISGIQENAQDSMILDGKVKASEQNEKDLDIETGDLQNDSVQQKLKKIMDKLKVLEEDLKGIGIDIVL